MTSVPTGNGASEADEPEVLEPVWQFDDVAGAIRAVDVLDGQMFVAASLPSGYLLWRGDLETSATDWLVEDVDPAIELVAADGEGGVVTVSGNLLRAYDADGRERWSTVPLRARADGASATIAALAVRDGAVLVGGDVYGAAAEVSLADGSVRWFLLQDQTAIPDAAFLGAGELVAFAGEDTAVLSGGLGSNRTVVAVDRASGEIRWTRFAEPALQPHLADDVLLLRPSRTVLAAVDPTSGAGLWETEYPDWQDDPMVQPPRVADDVVVTRNISATTGFALATGEELWTTDDRDRLLLSSSPVPYDGHVVGFVGQNTTVALQAADGSITAATYATGRVGTVEHLLVEGDRALVAARGSTNQQPSQMWLLDLSELG